VAEELLGEMIIVAMSEFYSEREVREMARGIDKVFCWYSIV